MNEQGCRTGNKTNRLKLRKNNFFLRYKIFVNLFIYLFGGIRLKLTQYNFSVLHCRFGHQVFQAPLEICAHHPYMLLSWRGHISLH